jgi:hypothetical protein
MPPVFGGRINWREPHDVTIGFLTDVLEAEDGTEQRAQLRSIETRTEAFVVSAYDRQSVAVLAAELYRMQGQRMVVPAWPDYTRLTSAVLEGATTLPCVTTDRGFTVGEYAVLWADPLTCEAVEITAVNANDLEVVPTDLAWNSTVLVMPGRVGKLVGDLPFTRINPIATDLVVAFEMETVETFGVADESGEEVVSYVQYGGDYVTYGGEPVIYTAEE